MTQSTEKSYVQKKTLGVKHFGTTLNFVTCTLMLKSKNFASEHMQKKKYNECNRKKAAVDANNRQRAAMVACYVELESWQLRSFAVFCVWLQTTVTAWKRCKQLWLLEKDSAGRVLTTENATNCGLVACVQTNVLSEADTSGRIRLTENEKLLWPLWSLIGCRRKNTKRCMQISAAVCVCVCVRARKIS